MGGSLSVSFIVHKRKRVKVGKMQQQQHRTPLDDVSVDSPQGWRDRYVYKNPQHILDAWRADPDNDFYSPDPELVRLKNE